MIHIGITHTGLTLGGAVPLVIKLATTDVVAVGSGEFVCRLAQKSILFIAQI